MILAFLGLSLWDIFVALYGTEDFDTFVDKEIPMSAVGQEGRQKYTTPARVQAWFLQRSREKWKQKYKDLKSNTKRLQNRVNDVTKSREHWREENEALSKRLRELEADNAALQEQLAAFKKDGHCGAT